MPSDKGMRELCAGAAELLRRAILTLAALPDHERKFLRGHHNSWPAPIRDPAVAYGYHAPRSVRFRPTPRDVDNCLPVLAWLTWLSRQNDGERDVKIITAKAFGCPTWKLAQRFGRSDSTISRWESGAIAAIAIQFRQEIEALL